MAFDVYPASHTTPLSVLAGATSSETAITEQFGAGNEMTIRVVMLGSGCAPSGGAPPTVLLRAGTGAAMEVPSLPNVAVIENGTSIVANAVVEAELNDVYRVRVFRTVATPQSWKIGIRNNDGTAHEFVWVVASIEAEASQPWIHATPALDYDVLVGESGVLTPESVRVENRGTGTLSLSDAPGTSLGAGFSLAGYAETGGGAVAPPIVLLPNQCIFLNIEFTAPSAPGPSSVTYDVNSNDSLAQTTPGTTHNRRVALTVKTARLEVVLLLDSSGSMSWRPDGTTTGTFEEQRWGLMYDAVEQFFVLLTDFGAAFGSDVGTFGVAVFNSNSATTIEASAKTPLTNDAKIIAVLDALKTRTPSGGTPIGTGIEHVLGPISNVSAFYDMEATPLDFNRRWMVLMSDGAHNEGTHPSTFYCSAPGSNNFCTKKVSALTIAYGEEGAADVDKGLLSTIAVQSLSGGGSKDAEISSLVDLKKALRDALIAGLSLQPVLDPPGLLSSGADEVRHAVQITRYDKRASFIVNWETFDPERITAQLLTPLCELITPDAAQRHPEIAFHRGSRSMIYTFSDAFLKNTADPARPRDGEWSLIISLNASDTSERIAHEVVVDSNLRLDVEFARNRHHAGDRIEPTARLTVNGVPIPNATVILKLIRPGQAFSNWLADSLVTAAEFERAQGIMRGDPSFFAIKSRALQLKGQRFPGFFPQSIFNMVDETGGGVYRTSVSSTTVTGTYELQVIATGTTGDGVTFRRERMFNPYLDVRPAREFTLVDILYGRPRTQDTLIAEVNVSLRDRFGNVLLLNPSSPAVIRLTTTGGQLVGSVQPNLDGTYSQTLQYPPGTQPVVGVVVNGEVIVPAQRLAAVDQLTFADQVVDFRLGGEAQPGINKHRDPQAALGNPTIKAPDTFVSLGAAGSLAVGVKGQAILPAADQDDIMVFVRPDTGRRAYKVEALPVGSRVDWVPLGSSSGITQGFDLRRAGLNSAQAVRIIDASGRMLDGNLKPAETPGVSIRGVGFAKVGPAPARQELPRALAWLLEIFGSKK